MFIDRLYILRIIVTASFRHEWKGFFLKMCTMLHKARKENYCTGLTDTGYNAVFIYNITILYTAALSF